MWATREAASMCFCRIVSTCGNTQRNDGWLSFPIRNVPKRPFSRPKNNRPPLSQVIEVIEEPAALRLEFEGAALHNSLCVLRHQTNTCPSVPPAARK